MCFETWLSVFPAYELFPFILFWTENSLPMPSSFTTSFFRIHLFVPTSKWIIHLKPWCTLLLFSYLYYNTTQLVVLFRTLLLHISDFRAQMSQLLITFQVGQATTLHWLGRKQIRIRIFLCKFIQVSSGPLKAADWDENAQTFYPCIVLRFKLSH